MSEAPPSLAVHARRSLVRAVLLGIPVVIVLLLAFDRLAHFADWSASKRLLVASLVGLPMGIVAVPMSYGESVVARRAASPTGCVTAVAPLLAAAFLTLVVASFEAAYVLGVAFWRSFDAGLMNMWWFASMSSEETKFFLWLLYVLACPAAITTAARGRGFTLGQQLYASVMGSFFVGSPALFAFGSVETGFFFSVLSGALAAVAASWPPALWLADRIDTRLVSCMRSET